MKQDRQLVPILLEVYKGDGGAVAELSGRGRRFVSTWKLRHEAGPDSGNKSGAYTTRTVSGGAVTAGSVKQQGAIPASASQIAESLLNNKLTEHVMHPTTVLSWLKTWRSPVRYLPLIRRHRLTESDSDGPVSTRDSTGTAELLQVAVESPGLIIIVISGTYSLGSCMAEALQLSVR